MPRPDGRQSRVHRPVIMETGFHRPSEGSVLYRAGGTVVLCTASIDDKVPPFLEGKDKGWITAEYQMHPRANPRRQDRERKAPSGRTQEIQRLVGRALRMAVDLKKIGSRTITIDCDVLEADGGTRTASITGGYVALAIAAAKVFTQPVLLEPVAAISVGLSRSGELALDLDYAEDSTAEVDLNVVATRGGKIVEVQGTAEGQPVERKVIDSMIDLALEGTLSLNALQAQALAKIGIELDKLVIR